MIEDDRAGFVRKLDDGSERWSAADTPVLKPAQQRGSPFS
jgi:hypothetical protein